VTGEVQTGDRKNVVTSMKLSDAKLTGTGCQAHVVNHHIPLSVDALKVDTECTTTSVRVCVCVCVCSH
jgi:hypothetical protein